LLRDADVVGRVVGAPAVADQVLRAVVGGARRARRRPDRAHALPRHRRLLADAVLALVVLPAGAADLDQRRGEGRVARGKTRQAADHRQLWTGRRADRLQAGVDLLLIVFGAAGIL